MFKRSAILFVVALLVGAGKIYGQQADFCEAVTAILRDAPNQFRNVHGGLKESNATATIFKTNIKVPGTINSRFVSSMGLFYEGALYQTRMKDGLMAVYERYKNELNNCLASQGFTMRTADNFYDGIQEFKKVLYMQPLPADADIKKLPGHVTLEVDYNKTNGYYTISFYIYEH